MRHSDYCRSVVLSQGLYIQHAKLTHWYELIHSEWHNSQCERVFVYRNHVLTSTVFNLSQHTWQSSQESRVGRMFKSQDLSQDLRRKHSKPSNRRPAQHRNIYKMLCTRERMCIDLHISIWQSHYQWSWISTVEELNGATQGYWFTVGTPT